VRVTTAFKRLLALDAVNVAAVEFGPSMIVVSVALRRRRVECPHCDYSTRWRYDTRRCHRGGGTSMSGSGNPASPTGHAAYAACDPGRSPTNTQAQPALPPPSNPPLPQP
jgi:hypothetical protein